MKPSIKMINNLLSKYDFTPFDDEWGIYYIMDVKYWGCIYG